MPVEPKLDGKHFGIIYKVKDCKVVPDDEYVVFHAADTAFANILPLYIEECKKLNCDKEQIDAVVRMFYRLEHWRRKHPDRIKVPDAAGEKLLG